MDQPAPATEESLPLICHVTPWYYRRMGLVAAMLTGMGLYFLYDGIWGYPKVNRQAEEKLWFEKEVVGSFDAAQKEGRLDAWMEAARAKGWPTGTDGEPPKWPSYAAPRNLPEEPKAYTREEIAGQYWWGYGTLGAAALVGLMVLLNFRKTLRLEEDHFVTDKGRTVRFADVFRVDKRKWEDKGLAYAYYKVDGAGAVLRAVIDDLKYHQADKILQRLLSRFKGELIEKVFEPDNDENETSVEK